MLTSYSRASKEGINKGWTLKGRRGEGNDLFILLHQSFGKKGKKKGKRPSGLLLPLVIGAKEDGA